MQTFGILILSGLTNGSVYALVGLSLAMTYGASRVINFAQGEFVMLGALSTVLFVTTFSLPMVVGIPMVLIVCATVGFLVERLAYRPLVRRGSQPLTIMIGTLACASIMTGTALLIWGPNQLFVPNAFSLEGVTIAGITSTPQQLAIIATFAFLMALIWFMLYRTTFGLTIRAVGIDPAVATLMGIRAETIIAFSFVFSAIVGGLTGGLVGPLLGGHVSMGIMLTIKGFMAVILGGMGSPFAAAAGGIAIGLLEATVAFYGNSFYAEPIIFGLILMMLIIRPTGLLGEWEANRK
ncbi:branched-chain amino acid ABC transporter permease [Microvirga antarctica]|uniref:branched-chain amino acid ABC transporter permease n=1 Tax=Microvirga antarctica TaxID=2819233 RepID=UPI001B317C85